MNDLAAKIKSARQMTHLTQKELGKAVGVSDKSVSAYEAGRSMPPLAKIKKIAETTKFPLSYFTQQESEDALIAGKLAIIEQTLLEVKVYLERKPKGGGEHVK